MQPWIPGFNASRPMGIKMPIWSILKNAPNGFNSSAMEMVQSLGAVLGRHIGNVSSAEQIFCIYVKTRIPFVLSMDAKNLVNRSTSLIQVDYNN